MGVQHSSQGLLLLSTFAVCTACASCEDAGNLGKDTDVVYFIDIANHVGVFLLVLEKEGAEVGLAALHHVLDSCDDGWVANNNCLVETWEKGTPSDR